MVQKNLIIVLVLLVLVGIAAGYPAITQADDSEGNFIFINYIGQEVNLDLDDTNYVVPGINIAPEGGRLVLQLEPGQHKFAASSPGVPGGTSGEFTLAPGQVVAKAARIEQTPLKVDHSGIVVALPEDYVFVFDFDPFAAPVEPAPVIDTWQPETAAAGEGSVVWINHYGDDGLTIDLAGEIYQVPAKVDEIPGRLQIDLAAGTYRYTASTPYGSINGEVNVIPGEVTGLNVTAELPEPIKYDVGDEFEGPQPITLNISEESLTLQVNMLPAEDTAPPELPETGVEIITPISVAGPTGLVVKNYSGDTLVFTINDQTFTIINNAEQTVGLPLGTYNYTASLPFIATTGTIELTGGNHELSVVTDVDVGVLNIYQN